LDRGVAVTIDAHVLLAHETQADEADRISREFASIGVSADSRIVSPTRSATAVGWLILAVLPLQPFFSQLANDFADDSYQHLKAFVTRLLRRRTAETGDKPKPLLVLQDTATGIQVVLEPDLPAESYQQLLSFDLTTIQQGPLHYDIHRHRWRSELDEQADQIQAP